MAVLLVPQLVAPTVARKAAEMAEMMALSTVVMWVGVMELTMAALSAGLWGAQTAAG